MFRSTKFNPSLGILLAAALAGPLYWAMPAGAQETRAAAAAESERLVITGTKATTDEELTRRVETALDSNRYLDASRITVTTKDGVVHLEGLVGDTGDLRDALRTANRVAGARRVVDELDTYEPDGYGQ